MYIWVVLATFIVAIYSFNLSHRSDMKELLTVPQAEALIGKMVVLHKGAEKYVRAHKKVDNGQKVALYYPGELKAGDELKDYLPYGFRNDSLDGEFKSLVYCLDKNDPNLSMEAPNCSNNSVSCCSGYNSKTYLVTFGCIPRKWRNVRTGVPRAEFFKAFRNVAVNGVEVGYAEYLTDEEMNDERNVFHSKMAMRARNINLVPIPQFIVNDKLSGADLSFSDVCGINNLDEEGAMLSHGCDKCLVYISPVS